MKTSVKRVETESPPITAMAMGAFDSEPSPSPIAMGMRPRIVQRVVMRMGRSLVRPPSTTASSIPRPRRAQPVRVVDQQDAVADHDPRHHDDPHEGGDREVGLGQEERPEHPDQSQGHGEHDDERVEQGLELGGQHHVHQDDGQDEGAQEGDEGFPLAFHGPAQVDLEVRGKLAA